VQDQLALQQESIYRKVTWRIMPLLLVCYIVAYLDRVNVGFAKLQMMQALGFSDVVYGLGAGIFFIGYFIFEVPSNIILHKVGARLWIGRIMISWGFLSAGMMLVSNETAFYIMRFLLGVAEAGFFPGIILYLTYWYPAQRRGRITAMFMTGIPLAGVVGGPLSGYIIKSFDGISALAGWQWMFLLEGVPAILLGLIVILKMDDRISAANWLTEEERQLLEKNIAEDAEEKQDHSVLHVLTSGRVWLMAFIYFSFVMGLYGVSFWLPTIIKAMGVADPLEIGLLSAIPYGAATIAMLLIAKNADRLRERRWHVAIPAVVGAIGLLLSAHWADNTLLAMSALTLATACIITTLPLFWSLPTAFLAGTGAAAGIAMINSLGNLAGFASPYAVGWLKQASGTTSSGMVLLASSLILGAILTISVPAKLVNK
jgi:D-galactonate transporter